MSEIRKWDLWWATVQYRYNDGEKERPVIVLDNEKPLVLVLPITSHEARNQWGEYEIIKWKSAGLIVPSVARVTEVCELRPSDFRKKIGKLDDLDIRLLQSYLEDYLGNK